MSAPATPPANQWTVDHLNADVSDRGFRNMPPLSDAFEDNAVRVMEASTADAPHIWLRVKDPEPGGHAVVMLSAEQAWQLKEQIEHLLEHHYQGDARPDLVRAAALGGGHEVEAPHTAEPTTDAEAAAIRAALVREQTEEGER